MPNQDLQGDDQKSIILSNISVDGSDMNDKPDTMIKE